MPRYLTSWNVAARKPSAASEMDNQADTILDSGGSTTNEPNCAAQLAGRNYAHPVDQLGSRSPLHLSNISTGSCVPRQAAFTAAYSAPD